jgi:hypothetical protein
MYDFELNSNLWPLVMMIKHATFVIRILLFLLHFYILSLYHCGLKQDQDFVMSLSQVEIYYICRRIQSRMESFGGDRGQKKIE